MEGGNASLAVDGNNATGYFICTRSTLEVKPWLRIDLLSTAAIRFVRVHSMEAKHREMRNIDVRAGNSSENGGKGNPPCQLDLAFPIYGNILDVNCPEDTVARYVTINTSSDDYEILRICELEVYGFYV